MKTIPATAHFMDLETAQQFLRTLPSLREICDIMNSRIQFKRYVPCPHFHEYADTGAPSTSLGAHTLGRAWEFKSPRLLEIDCPTDYHTIDNIVKNCCIFESEMSVTIHERVFVAPIIIRQRPAWDFQMYNVITLAAYSEWTPIPQEPVVADAAATVPTEDPSDAILDDVLTREPTTSERRFIIPSLTHVSIPRSFVYHPPIPDFEDNLRPSAFNMRFYAVNAAGETVPLQVEPGVALNAASSTPMTRLASALAAAETEGDTGST